MIIRYSADFETTTDIDDCRVWAWGICDVSEYPDAFYYGNSIDSFIEQISKMRNSLFYFHNARFDADFILNYLFQNGYTHNTNSRELKENQFSTLISDDGKFYSMKICFKGEPKNNIVEIRDSLKLLNMSVSAMAETFKLEDKKLEIDYNEYREAGHELTQQEKDYLRNDIVIVSKSLALFFKFGGDRLTAGSNALHKYYEMIGGMKQFRREYPKLAIELDKDLRQAYKGGFTYCNPAYAGKDIEKGIVLDVNSLYPWSMHSPNLLPYGKPKKFEGEYKENKKYPLYIQRLRCGFEIKKNYIPCIQIKNTSRFVPNEYLSSSNNEIVTLTLTNIDLALFLEHYETYELEFFGGWMFKGIAGAFDKYIDYWMEQKIKASIEGNAGLRATAKLYLNSLYGKFATSPYVRSAIPYYDDKVRYTKDEWKERDTIYLPVGEFITAIARNKTIRTAQSVYDRFLYADTDSLHLIGTDEPNIEIDDNKLGAWKHESTFRKARFVRQKTYIEESILSDKEYAKISKKYPDMCYQEEGLNLWLKVTCSGLPERCYKQVDFNNFRIGAQYYGKLTPKRVYGGTVLIETTYNIKG